MKVREKRVWEQGMGGRRNQVRVIELAEKDVPPAGAEGVPDETPVSDWTDEEETE